MHIEIYSRLIAEALSSFRTLLSFRGNDRLLTLRADTDKGILSLSIMSGRVAAKLTLNQALVGNLDKLAIKSSGVALLDGTRLIRSFTFEGGPQRTSIFLQSDVSKLHERLSDDSDSDEVDKLPIIGVLILEQRGYGLIGIATYRHDWEPVVEPGNFIALIGGEELINHTKFTTAYDFSYLKNAKWTTLSFSLADGELKIVGTNGHQLPISTFPITQFCESCTFVVETSDFKQAMHAIREDLPVSMSLSGGHLIISQELVLSGRKSGDLSLRIPLSESKPLSYRPLIDKIKFRSSCKISTMKLRHACLGLNVVERVRTKLRLNVKKRMLYFSKSDDVSFVECLQTEVIEAAGPDIELDISSWHLALPASQSTGENVEIKFSTKSSMAVFILDHSRKVYFPPFTSR